MVRRAHGSTVLVVAVLLMSCGAEPTGVGPSGDGPSGDGPSGDRLFVPVEVELPAALGPVIPIRLDTAELDRRVRAERPVLLPFVRSGRRLVAESFLLREVPLRASGLTDAILKDGRRGDFQRIPLGPTGSYQGRPSAKRGSAAATVTPQALEVNMLLAEGWSIVEPLEPVLRLHEIPPVEREAILAVANHVAYHTTDLERHVEFQDTPGFSRVDEPPVSEIPDEPLLATVVADGDREFLAAYPLDSVMPFWRKQEAMLNVMHWLFGCVEPAARRHDDLADCGNDLDGGHWGALAVRLQVERLEVWSDGGPDSGDRQELLRQSIRQSHQSEPPCCGPPHSAGHAALVHFFSGKALAAPAGEAAGVGGIAVYGDTCDPESSDDLLCHHAFSQMVPQGTWPSLAFHQQILVGHEIGHNAGGPEDPGGFGACWVFEQQCGPALMASLAFGPFTKLLYAPTHCEEHIVPMLVRRLGPAEASP